MRKLLTNWRVLLLLFLLVGSLLMISFNGLKWGVDFKGGTLFQIHLAEPLKNRQEIESVTSTIEQRLDWTGLKDTQVTAWGSDVDGVEFVIAQIAETDPEEVENIEALLLKQGKFEVMIDGNLMFEGSDILQVQKEVNKGYNYRQVADNTYEWKLPFVLTEEGSKKFSRGAFHKCTLSGFNQDSGSQYICSKTYFFIDRPSEAILLVDILRFESERQEMQAGNLFADIPPGTSLSELLQNAQMPYLTYSETLAEEDLNTLQGLKASHKSVLIASDTSDEIKAQLEGMEFILKEVPLPEDEPWIWRATGAKKVISLTEGVTNNKPYVENIEDAEIFSSLYITGITSTSESAKNELQNLTILLESGSLPVPVDDISKETISPSLGKEFLFYAALIGLAAIIIVSIVIFIRYRIFKLTLPIVFTALSEVVLLLGFASLINWNLDLAAVTGILAVVGTGVDHQIIITDELKRKGVDVGGSLLARAKAAFFIIFAAATTTIATMSPIIFFGLGLGKLIGFAITTIAGVLIGVLISRPAYSEIAKRIMEKG
jgi:preprotein translocase subunit SecD